MGPGYLPVVTRAAIPTGLTKFVLSEALSLGTAHETWWPGKQCCPIPSSLNCHLLLRATILNSPQPPKCHQENMSCKYPRVGISVSEMVKMSSRPCGTSNNSEVLLGLCSDLQEYLASQTDEQCYYW